MEQTKLSFVFVGSLSVRKAAWNIIQAIKNLPETNLTIIGDGEQRKLIEKSITKYGLKNIKLLGTRNNSEILQLIADKDIFIMSSHYDGWGAVVNEALTCGLYVICTDKSGAKDLLVNSNRGIIYKTGNIPQLRKCIQLCYKKASDIQNTRQERMKWAECNIGGKTIATYFIDCLQGLNPSKPWANP